MGETRPTLRGTAPAGSAAYPGAPGRIGAIDALRGLVMLLMLVDHVRGFFYAHMPLRNPMDLALTPPDLFLTRTVTHLCAPVFILLTGLSAYLYAQKRGSRSATARFLLTRGLVLVLLEVTLVNLAWTGSPTPPVLSLQVIWAIGLSMIALAGLLWLPRGALAGLALGLMLGHNGLDFLVLAPDQAGFVPWSILHQRALIPLPWGAARTSYPVLPWIGVIAAGYALGPLFAPAVAPRTRLARLASLAALALTGFAVLRTLNGYGDPAPWQAGLAPEYAALSFVNLTKYPPSADFLLLTLGIGLALLAAFEALPARGIAWLTVFGGAPLFFYLVHLGSLRLMQELAVPLALTGASGRLEAPSVGALWLIAGGLSLPLYLACRWMIGLKRAARWPWLAYL